MKVTLMAFSDNICFEYTLFNFQGHVIGLVIVDCLLNYTQIRVYANVRSSEGTVLL